MVKSKPLTTDTWQHLYRALLRSSAASVRFSRPAARNTRRYLRDDFAGALVADRDATARKPSGDVAGGSHAQMTGARSCTGSNASLSASASEVELRRRTHNTLAFHLSASLLPSGSGLDRRSSQATCLYQDDAALASPSTADALVRGNITQQHVEARPPRANDTPATSTLGSTDAEVQLPTHNPAKPAKPAARLAHRVVSNLASLTYHHLSPHTQMQTRAHRRQNRARKPTKLSSLARVLGKIEAADVSLDPAPGGLESVFSSSAGGAAADETTLNALHMKLAFLVPSAKPARGPVSARLKEWDSQHADKIASEGSLRQMQADLDTVKKVLQQHAGDAATRQQPRSLAKQVQQLKAEAEQLRRNIKSATKALAQVEAREELEGIAVGHLADLVAAAQESEQLMLGKTRWMARKRGEFLPP